MRFERSKVPGEDIKRGMEMVQKRRDLIAATPADPIVYDFGVNALARSLHPGYMKAAIVDKKEVARDCVKITLRSLKKDGRFPYFRAGQFVTLGKRVGTSYLSRPYSLVSSPKEALEGKYEIIVQKKGTFSSHLVDDAPINSEVEVLEPSGDFCYDDLRDRKHILAIAGGSGVTPFISMMKAIREGSEEYRLTLLYGVRTLKDLFFDPKDYEDDKIKIVIVLSDEEAEAYRHGFIDKELILENMDEETDIFMCGPDALYRHVEKQLEGLDKEIRIRKERNSIGDRKVDEEKIYKLIVHMRDEVFEIEAKNNETLVAAMERAGIKAPVKCKTGVCGFCHSRVIKGNYTIEEGNDFRRSADKIFNYIHPCCTYPESDMEIDVPYTKEEG